jgi:uncharacterized protein YjdB
MTLADLRALIVNGIAIGWLVACGGGGGGSAPAPPPAPVAQTIAFSTGGTIAKTFGDAPFTNAATGGAGTGATTYVSSSPAVASVDASGTVTILAAGSTSITATKAADGGHLAAQATYTINVARAPQSIAFTLSGPIAKLFGDMPFTNTAAGGIGTGAISYATSNAAVATVDAAGRVAIVGGGSAQIVATKAADTNHLAATANYQLEVAAISQPIAFAQSGPLARNFGDAGFTNPVNVGAAVGSMTWTSSDAAVLTVNPATGIVSIVGAGSANITVTRAANANYLAAQATYRVDVARAAQLISFADAGPVIVQVGAVPFRNVASGGDGTGAITYVSGNPATAAVDYTGEITAGIAGTAIITATKAASANHHSAQATYSVQVISGTVEVPFTAWMNTTDSEVTLPTAAAGATFARALTGNCVMPLSTTCVATTTSVLGSLQRVDTIAGLGRSASYWLERGASNVRPVLVDQRRYRDSLTQPVEFQGQLWLVGTTDGTENWSSADGRGWLRRNVSLPWGQRTGSQVAVFDDKIFFVGGRTPWTSDSFNDVWSSFNGITWTRLGAQPPPFAAREDHQLVAFNGRLWLIGGVTQLTDQRHNDVWSTTDGFTWTLATANAAFSPRRDHRVTVFNGRMWLTGGSSGAFDSTTLDDAWSSADGVTWRPEAALGSGPRRQHASIAYGGRLYLAGGYDGTASRGDVWSTSDGVNWVQDAAMSPFGKRTRGSLIPYRGRVWLLSGWGAIRAKNDAWSTTDLVTWNFEHTGAPFPQERPGRLIAYDNRLWLLGPGNDGTMEVWSSPDGGEWTKMPGTSQIPGRTFFNVAVHANRLWLQGGFVGSEPFDTVNDVWSTDGTTWIRATGSAPFSARYASEMFSMNGRLFVVGGIVPGAGQRSDIWSSADGANWREDAAASVFGDRFFHQIVVFNGRAWLLGGQGGGFSPNPQIWSSADGVAWHSEGSHAQAVGRYQHRAVVHDNRIWITGGQTSPANLLGDAWYSSDGMNWTQQLTGSPGYSPRLMHGFTSLNAKLWMFGGEGIGGETDSHDMMSSTEATDWRFRYHNFIEVP